MTGPIRQDINYTRCNAYSAIAHMYSAISVEGRQVIDIQLSGYKDLSWSLGIFFKARYTDTNGTESFLSMNLIIDQESTSRASCTDRPDRSPSSLTFGRSSPSRS